MNKKQWTELQKQSRVLLFRAYHRKYGMIYPEEYLTLESAISGDLNFFGSPSKDYDTDEFIFTQYTGLKDKHGNPVYEGDIVKAVLLDDYGDNPEEVIEEVTIHEGLLAPFYMRVRFEEEWWKDHLQDGFEVIGNVYEHPNLLERR